MPPNDEVTWNMTQIYPNLMYWLAFACVYLSFLLSATKFSAKNKNKIKKNKKQKLVGMLRFESTVVTGPHASGSRTGTGM